MQPVLALPPATVLPMPHPNPDAMFFPLDPADPAAGFVNLYTVERAYAREPLPDTAGACTAVVANSSVGYTSETPAEFVARARVVLCPAPAIKTGPATIAMPADWPELRGVEPGRLCRVGHEVLINAYPKLPRCQRCDAAAADWSILATNNRHGDGERIRIAVCGTCLDAFPHVDDIPNASDPESVFPAAAELPTDRLGDQQTTPALGRLDRLR